jgi:hypothetical protein
MTRVSGTQKKRVSLLDNYVFMDKTQTVLEIAFKTGKNVILHGPGGHGKSEYTTEFFYDKNIAPYVMTMGTGITTDRLFGGFDAPKCKETGKIEYLVENSFMNHEYVIFEELMDAPDYILEQLKDILSSGYFRNGTQIFKIKTKLIVGCTNKTRKEFGKNASLKALLERFPLDHCVTWDNYTENSYMALLQKNFVQEIDPIIPFLLQEYSRNNIVISPRIALDAYDIYSSSGPDALIYIAEFSERPTLINDTLARFKEVIRFKQLGMEIEDIINGLNEIPKNVTEQDKQAFVDGYKALNTKHAEVRVMTVTDDLITAHTGVLQMAATAINDFKSRYVDAERALRGEEAPSPKKRKNPYFDKEYTATAVPVEDDGSF